MRIIGIGSLDGQMKDMMDEFSSSCIPWKVFVVNGVQSMDFAFRGRGENEKETRRLSW